MPRVHLPCLAAALTIMVVGTLYPPLMADASGHADHGMATALFCAMSAGFVRGVGFVPHILVWRWLFSGWACALELVTAVALQSMH
ncbi:MAG: cyd operon YbgE family protein [Pseudomonadota bacterium]|nr:cyd operon YbgE family protein [Pseudomonadota bacterium]